LQDPSDKRFVLADDTLEKLTGEKRFKAFGAVALFKHHFIKK
jgi:chromatin remodeling complex protein RSC6